MRNFPLIMWSLSLKTILPISNQIMFKGFERIDLLVKSWWLEFSLSNIRRGCLPKKRRITRLLPSSKKIILYRPMINEIRCVSWSDEITFEFFTRQENLYEEITKRIFLVNFLLWKISSILIDYNCIVYHLWKSLIIVKFRDIRVIDTEKCCFIH
jgi:hypothetical protein